MGCKNKFKSLNSKPYLNNLNSKHQNYEKLKSNFHLLSDEDVFFGQLISDEYFEPVNYIKNLVDAFIEILDDSYSCYDAC